MIYLSEYELTSTCMTGCWLQHSCLIYNEDSTLVMLLLLDYILKSAPTTTQSNNYWALVTAYSIAWRHLKDMEWLQSGWLMFLKNWHSTQPDWFVSSKELALVTPWLFDAIKIICTCGIIVAWRHSVGYYKTLLRAHLTCIESMIFFWS